MARKRPDEPPINNAPNNVVHTLALDDEIAVAGPVLASKSRCSTRFSAI